jgi:hypothetical protein
MFLGVIFVRPAPEPPAPENSADSAEPTETTPLVARPSTSVQGDDLNVSGWALFGELDFYLIFLYNGLCSGVGLCCE